MAATDPDKARQFAVEVVRRLRQAGYEALWAGGCVRDQLLGRQPEDFDVATNATPREIRRLFGRRRTVPVGAAFGVITVLGPPGAGQIEVATFREDDQYSDGRRPDRVVFSTAEADARRRDFTINGMFYDPLEDRVIDYVGGRRDLQARLIRAIGDPDARLAEDKLRLIRAVRFAANLGFQIEPATWEAVRRRAAEIRQVAAERIAEEMRRLLGRPGRARGAELLRASGLLDSLAPEVAAVARGPSGQSSATPSPAWRAALRLLESLPVDAPFPWALAALVRETAADVDRRTAAVQRLGRRWRLTNDEIRQAAQLLRDEPVLRQARTLPWPLVQRVLAQPEAERSLEFAEAAARALGRGRDDVAWCRAKRRLPPEQWNPPPLITGEDLKQLGAPPGPAYRNILDRVRDAQLLGQVKDRADAIGLARALWRQIQAESGPQGSRPGQQPGGGRAD